MLFGDMIQPATGGGSVNGGFSWAVEGFNRRNDCGRGCGSFCKFPNNYDNRRKRKKGERKVGLEGWGLPAHL